MDPRELIDGTKMKRMNKKGDGADAKRRAASRKGRKGDDASNAGLLQAMQNQLNSLSTMILSLGKRSATDVIDTRVTLQPATKKQAARNAVRQFVGGRK